MNKKDIRRFRAAEERGQDMRRDLYPLTTEEFKVCIAAMLENQSKVTRTFIMDYLDCTYFEAKQIHTSIKDSGWLYKDNRQRNAFTLTPRAKAQLALDYEGV